MCSFGLRPDKILRAIAFPKGKMGSLNPSVWLLLSQIIRRPSFIKLVESKKAKREIGMKKLTIFLIFLFYLVGCATEGSTPLGDFEAKPDVFCNLIQKPDPLLMGTWECSFSRYVGRSRPDENYVKYQLRKYDDKYGLYFYRTWRSGRKKKSEWKDWAVNGKEILGESRFGVKIFVQDNGVYFTIRGLDEPVKMSRVAD